jgi:hypothetical protein
MMDVEPRSTRKRLFCKCGHCKSIHRLSSTRNPGCNVDRCKCKNFRPVEVSDKQKPVETPS